MNAQARSVGQYFADISKTIDKKIEAISPGWTSSRAATSPARWGRISGHEYAEAYEILRGRI